MVCSISTKYFVQIYKFTKEGPKVKDISDSLPKWQFAPVSNPDCFSQPWPWSIEDFKKTQHYVIFKKAHHCQWVMMMTMLIFRMSPVRQQLKRLNWTTISEERRLSTARSRPASPASSVTTSRKPTASSNFVHALVLTFLMFLFSC